MSDLVLIGVGMVDVEFPPSSLVDAYGWRASGPLKIHN